MDLDERDRKPTEEKYELITKDTNIKVVNDTALKLQM
jgi:hypothetical protein